MLERTKGGCWTRGSARAFAGLALSTLVVLAAPTAHAQGAQGSAAAQALFDEGRKLMAAGKIADACPKLEESQRLAPAVGTLLNLGLCYEREDRSASAWGTFKEAVSAARASGQSDRETFAHNHAQALEGKISTLTIHVPASMADVSGLVVRRDGEEIPEAAWGTAIPMDAGSHRIEASAPSHVAWSTTVSIQGEKSNASVDVPVLAAVKTTLVASKPASHVSAPPQSPSTMQRTLGLVVGGVGLAGIGTGAVFGLVARAQNDAATAHHCGADNLCDAQGVGLTNQARTSAIASTVSFGVGGAALITGAVLFFTAPKHSAPRAGVGVSPILSAQGGGVSVGGAW